MKKYNITVNGTKYEVEVEEIGSIPVQSAAPKAPAAPAAASAPAPAAAPAPAPAAAPAAPKTAGDVPTGAEKITAPIPGKVIAIAVRAGQTVKANDLILTLEAMKMQNEIYCSKGGKVLDVLVTEGGTVSANEVMVVIG